MSEGFVSFTTRMKDLDCGEGTQQNLKFDRQMDTLKRKLVPDRRLREVIRKQSLIRQMFAQRTLVGPLTGTANERRTYGFLKSP